MPDLTVRRLGAEDAPLFREIRLLALMTEPENYASTHAEWAARPIAAFENLLENVRYTAAEAGGQMVGVCGWYPMTKPTVRHRGVLVAVFVLPEWRGKGVFAAMMRPLLAEAAAQVRQLELHVSADNPVAIAAYQAQGFTEIGRIPAALQHEGQFRDELLMMRALTA